MGAPVPMDYVNAQRATKGIPAKADSQTNLLAHILVQTVMILLPIPFLQRPTLQLT